MKEVQFYSRLRRQFRANLPFVVYKHPNDTKSTESCIKAFLQLNLKRYSIADYKECGFIIAPFNAEEPAFYIPERFSEVLSFEEKKKEKTRISENIADITFSSEAKEKHLDLIKKTKFEIETGKMQKAVLSRREKVGLSKKDPVGIFRELAKTYPSAFVYCWFHPKIGLWVGATPEALLKIKNHKFETMALAGTQKFEGELHPKWGEKEKQEQQFVTDAILFELQKINFNDLKVSDTYTFKAGGVLHLRTDISGTPEKEENLKQLIEALHPTPAVCGLPKEKAKAYILKKEDYNREFYTGFLGELNIRTEKRRSRNRRNIENLAYKTVERQTSLFVNLRCMKIEDDHAYVYIGGGITQDSIPEEEWEETVNKAQTMKKVLLK